MFNTNWLVLDLWWKGEISVESNSSQALNLKPEASKCKESWGEFPWRGNLILNLSWYEKSNQGIINSQHQIHFLVLINNVIPILSKIKIHKINLHVLQLLNGLMRNTQYWKENFLLGMTWKMFREITSHHHKCGSSQDRSLIWWTVTATLRTLQKSAWIHLLLQEIPPLAASYPWFIWNALLLKLCFFKLYL